jgi:hypothetical protein
VCSALDRPWGAECVLQGSPCIVCFVQTSVIADVRSGADGEFPRKSKPGSVGSGGKGSSSGSGGGGEDSTRDRKSKSTSESGSSGSSAVGDEVEGNILDSAISTLESGAVRDSDSAGVGADDGGTVVVSVPMANGSGGGGGSTGSSAGVGDKHPNGSPVESEASIPRGILGRAWGKAKGPTQPGQPTVLFFGDHIVSEVCRVALFAQGYMKKC